MESSFAVNYFSQNQSIYADKITLGVILLTAQLQLAAQQGWQSAHVRLNEDKSLVYSPDEDGNIIPDFSEVGYKAGKENLPFIPVVKQVMPAAGNRDSVIQQAIDEVAKMPLRKDGFRGAILLLKGVYVISGTIKIKASGIVLRGEGSQTKLVAAGKGKRNLVSVSGEGNIKELEGSRKKIIDAYVSTGAKSFRLNNTNGLNAGDRIILYRPGTQP